MWTLFRIVAVATVAATLTARVASQEARSDFESFNIPGSGFVTSGWIGSAYADAQTGHLSHCFVAAVYEGDFNVLSFSLTPDGVFNFGFRIEPASRATSATVFIDDLEPLRWPITRLAPDSALLSFPASESLIEAFQAGWWLTIDLGLESKTFKLRGTRNSLDALKDCVTRYWFYEGAIPSVDSKAQSDNQPSDQGTNERLREPENNLFSTGTAFWVSDAGYLLTNAHLVENCTDLHVDGVAAELVQKSTVFDLAIISSIMDVNDKSAVFSSLSAMLNSDVTVAGYPLMGVLGGLNVTRGSVSSLKGYRGSELDMQISAPVQPGNSGGPVLNASGHIVGVVVSKLDAQLVAEAIGDIPQNVNFAIRGEIAKLFL